jgi:hypothetical protein
MPTKLLISMTTGTNVSPITITIPSSLQSLDSGQLAGGQSGFNSVDLSVRNIFRCGGFFDSAGVWYSASQISSIVPQ